MEKIDKIASFLQSEYGGYVSRTNGNNERGTIEVYTDDHISRSAMEPHDFIGYTLTPVRSNCEDNEYEGLEENKPIDWVDEYYSIVYEYKQQ